MVEIGESKQVNKRNQKQWWQNDNGGNDDETCDEIGKACGCKVQAHEASKQLTCIVKGRRNSRNKKSTPSIQNYKTPKQKQTKKTNFQENFQESLNFKQCEKALSNVRERKRERFVFLYWEQN